MAYNQLPIRKEPHSPIMWRAYQVGLNRAGQLILAGAYNGKWTDEDFVAKCTIGADRDSGGAAMRQRAYQSKVFMPGELSGSRRPDDLALAHRRCKLHLETGACSCGVWGYKAPARVQREYLNTPFWTGSYGPAWVQVLCSVRIYGTILVGEWGYRASNARIESMFVPANINMYALRHINTMAPYYDDNSMSFFTTEPSGYTNGASVMPQRIDPEVVWNKIAKTYEAAQVIHVPDGPLMIRQLDVDNPDPMLKPVGWEPPIMPPLWVSDDD